MNNPLHFIQIINQIIKNPDSFDVYLSELKKSYPELINEFSDFENNLFQHWLPRHSTDVQLSRFNKVLLQYALHKYNTTVPLLGKDDLLDSVASSINMLGEELIFSTVTTHYMTDIFNSIPDILFAVDNLGVIQYVNKKTIEEFNEPEAEIVKRDFNEFFLEKITLKELDEYNASEKVLNMIRIDGSIFPVSIRTAPFVRGDNQPIGQIIIARDISKILKYQYEIEKQNSEIREINNKLSKALVNAQESDKLKSAFLANISHEVRTPLNGIIGFSGLIKEKCESEEEYNEFGSIIHNCGNQLLGVFDSILEVSRIEANQVKINKDICNISSLLKEVYATYYHKIIKSDKNINLILNNSFENSQFRYVLDKQKITQSLTNLLENSYKFTNEGEIELGAFLNNNLLHFYVRDTGMGIPADQIDVICKPFMQASNAGVNIHGGSGLGLSIVKGFIEAMGGNIEIQSVINQGTHITLTLPASISQENIITESIPISYNWSDKKILYIEDEYVNVEYLKAVFKTTMSQIEVAMTGKDALDIINFNKNYDLIITDLRLPDMSGYDIIKYVRTHISETVPMVIFSAYNSENERIKCIQIGCNEFISKPVASMAFIEKVSKHLK